MSFVYSSNVRSRQVSGESGASAAAGRQQAAPAAAPTAAAAPGGHAAFPLLPPVASDASLPGLLPLLDALVARHLKASEAQCSGSGAEGRAFHEAARAACSALVDGARQHLAEAVEATEGEAREAVRSVCVCVSVCVCGEWECLAPRCRDLAYLTFLSSPTLNFPEP
jgi:hypothetical protein